MRRILHDIWVVVKPVSWVLLAAVILVVLVVVPTLTGSTGTVKNNLNGVALSAARPGRTGRSPGTNRCSAAKPVASSRTRRTRRTTTWLLARDRRARAHRQCPDRPDALRRLRRRLHRPEPGLPVQVPDHLPRWHRPGGLRGAERLPVGGGAVPGSGQYIANFDPSTGQQIWRTYLTNVNTSGQWLALGSLAILKDGTLAAASRAHVLEARPRQRHHPGLPGPAHHRLARD